MRRRKVLTLGLVALVCLFVAGTVTAQRSPNFDTTWSRLSGGGGERASPGFQLQDITGQWVFSTSSSANNVIYPEFFWSGDAIAAEFRVYLPTVLKP